MNYPIIEIFSAFAATAWRASWLIVVVLALRLLARRHVPAQVWCVAWLLIAARLLLPFTVPAAWSPFHFAASSGLPVVATPPPPAVRAIVEQSNAPATTMPLANPARELPPTPVLDLAIKPVAAAVAPSPGHSWWEVLSWVWLAGAGLLIMMRLAAAMRLRGQLRDAVPLPDERVLAFVRNEARGRRVPTCWETRAVDAPALCGLFRSRLLFPPGLTAKLSDAELRLVVRHELSHWRRRDLWAQEIIHAAAVVHWLNPLAWVVARLAHADCELACDEAVLRREAGSGTAYGETLLKVLSMVGAGRRAGPVVAILEGRQQLADRLRRIAAFRAGSAWRVVAPLAVVAFLVAASLTRPVRAEPTVAPAPSSTSAAPNAAPNAPTSAATPADRLDTLFKKTPQGWFLRPSPAEAAAAAPAGAVAASQTASASPADAAEDSGRDVVGSQAAALTKQRQIVDQLRRELMDFKTKNEITGVDVQRDILSDRLKSRNDEFNRQVTALQTAQARIDQINAQQQKAAPLADLPFVASQPLVARLLEQQSKQRVELSQLRERYRDRHPKLIEAEKGLAATEAELTRAVETIRVQFLAERDAARAALNQTQQVLSQAKEEALAFDRVAAEYTARQRELETQQQILTRLSGRGPEVEPSPLSSLPSPRASTPIAERSRAPDDFTISVVGAVNNQSGVVFAANERPIVLDAIARAGGFTANANRAGVRIVRSTGDGGRATLTLAEEALMNGTGDAGSLQRGDVVIVPELPRAVPRSVTIFGAVNKPGYVPLPEAGLPKLTIVGLIALAGGPSRLADLKRVQITRVNATTRATQALTVNVADFMRGASDLTAVELEAGDMVMVPERIL